MKRLFLHIRISLVGALVLLSLSASAQGRKVSGYVMLESDGKMSPGENVTVYVKESQTGAVADGSGHYTLTIPSRYSDNKLSVEFSLIGYKTCTQTVRLKANSTVALDTVVLGIQPLMLAASYLIDNGMSPEEYIMSKLWDKADANRKIMEAYNAHVQYSISTHEIPLLAQVLSGFEKGTVKLAAGITGYGPLVRHCLSNDDVSATVSMDRSVRGKKTTDYNKRIVSSNEPLPDGVAENIMSLPEGIDFFEALYDRKNPWGEKFTRKHRFTLIGTYEYDGKLVDVLYCTDSQDIIKLKLHVVEEDWGFLRVEVGKENDMILFECRDIGRGIYMPVSLVMKPTMSRIRNSEIPKAIEDIKENRHLNKGTKKRAEALLTRSYESGLDFNPYIVAGFNISYSNFYSSKSK